MNPFGKTKAVNYFLKKTKQNINNLRKEVKQLLICNVQVCMFCFLITELTSWSSLSCYPWRFSADQYHKSHTAPLPLHRCVCWIFLIVPSEWPFQLGNGISVFLSEEIVVLMSIVCLCGEKRVEIISWGQCECWMLRWICSHLCDREPSVPDRIFSSGNLFLLSFLKSPFNSVCCFSCTSWSIPSHFSSLGNIYIWKFWRAGSLQYKVLGRSQGCS